MESKASIRRYLEEVPLTTDERSIVEGNQVKVERFIHKLQEMSTAEENSVEMTETPILDIATLNSLLLL
ncbi:hypothetical protein [Pseudomonas sp. EpS/L25]|uniref:hypothetical protein n=1 Tax=Pseudomonas sp. EpS/L25 TaxID=1749078 RepID=UPI00191C3BB4|nr:hypothetical protein [Pseudomonas sp. EpS/L25]